MCGIVGVVSSFLTDRDKKIFQDLLRVSVLRGIDSTGIIAATQEHTANKPPEYITWRSTRDAVSALKHPSERLKHVLSPGKQTRCLIGHTRAATKGELTEKNAHPFDFPRVVGVHNGTIHSYLTYEKTYDTDSEALYREINDRGLVEALKMVNKNTYSSGYTLAFIDKETDELVLVRNDKRPLFLTFNKAENTMFFASEAAFLRLILSRYNETYENQTFPALKVDTEMRFPLNGMDALAKMYVNKLDVKPAYTTTYYHAAHYDGKREADKRAANQSALFPGTQTGQKAGNPSVPHVPQGSNADRSQTVKNGVTLARTGADKGGVSNKKNKPGPHDPSEGLSNRQRRKLERQVQKQARIMMALRKKREKETEKGKVDEAAILQGIDKTIGERAADIAKHAQVRGFEQSPTPQFMHNVVEGVFKGGGERPPDSKEADDGISYEVQHAEFDDEVPLYFGYLNQPMSREEMEAALNKHGCSFCSVQEDIQHHQQVHWMRESEYICGSCMDHNPDLMTYIGGYRH